MASVCFYFQVHQPYRIKRFRIFDIGKHHKYFDDDGSGNLNNRNILAKVAHKSYLPANRLLLDLLKKHPQFRASFSLSGVVLEQMEQFMPEVIVSFQELVRTGRIELLSETYYHSLSFLYSKDEFTRQIAKHTKLIERLFGVTPTVFRNTELIYNNDIAAVVAGLGYKGILAEGADHVLEWRSPNFLYQAEGAPIKLLLKNYKLSDDIAFRFGSRDWPEYPLTPSKFAEWVSAVNGNGHVVNLFMDYETFGEHQWEDTGIFRFLAGLPGAILQNPDNGFVTPSEAIERFTDVGPLDVVHYVSWADIERDVSAWLGNPMQQDAIRLLYQLEEKVMNSEDRDLIDDWQKLTTSDHFYYMCTKWFADGDVHKYFNPYESPYEAFIAFMNVIQDIKIRVKKIQSSKSKLQRKKDKIFLGASL